MSVQYFYKGNEILHIRSSIFETLYQNMLEIVEEKKITLSSSMEFFFDKLYAGIGGIGLDIAKYIKTKKDMVFFSEIIKEAIERFEKRFPDLSQESKNRLWNFHNQLVKYANELE